MIDMHSHVLPEVDDGAVSVEMALEMLDAAYRGGTDSIVLTPHYAHAFGYENPAEKIRVLFGQLQHIVRQEGIPIRMYLGCEYLMADPEEYLREWKTVQRINDTRYQLIEFFFEAPEQEILDGARAVRRLGLIPVIAHPERYECIKRNPGFARVLSGQGALLQLNKGSPLGLHGRSAQETSFALLQDYRYSLVGSDTHRPRIRDPYMGKTFDLISDYFGLEYSIRIFEENPRRVLKNIDIAGGAYARRTREEHTQGPEGNTKG